MRTNSCILKLPLDRSALALSTMKIPHIPRTVALIQYRRGPAILQTRAYRVVCIRGSNCCHSSTHCRATSPFEQLHCVPITDACCQKEAMGVPSTSFRRIQHSVVEGVAEF